MKKQGRELFAELNPWRLTFGGAFDSQSVQPNILERDTNHTGLRTCTNKPRSTIFFTLVALARPHDGRSLRSQER